MELLEEKNKQHELLVLHKADTNQRIGRVSHQPQSHSLALQELPTESWLEHLAANSAQSCLGSW